MYATPSDKIQNVEKQVKTEHFAHKIAKFYLFLLFHVKQIVCPMKNCRVSRETLLFALFLDFTVFCLIIVLFFMFLNQACINFSLRRVIFIQFYVFVWQGL